MKAIKPLIWPTYFEPVLNKVEMEFDDLLWSKVPEGLREISFKMVELQKIWYHFPYLN